MFAGGCTGPRPCVAGLNALVPRVTKLDVPHKSALFEPSTAATTTTRYTRFRDGAASGASGTEGRCLCCNVFFVFCGGGGGWVNANID